MKNFFRSVLILLVGISFSVSLYAQECGVIYITPNGASSGTAGTRANPANLTYGLTLVSLTDTRLWLAAGTYNTATEIPLVNNVTIEGGFDATTWIKSNATPSIIHRTNQIVLIPANGTAVFFGFNVSGFRLQDLTLTMDIPNGVASSAYGIYLNGCSNYNIVRVDVTAADGTPGVAGVAGTNGAPGSPGANGANGNSSETGRNVPTPGGAGGSNGGDGAGNGAHSGSSNIASTAGGGACGGAAGASGTGPPCNLGCAFGSPNCNAATPGQPGTAATCAGTNGTNGVVGGAGTIGGLGYFIPGGAGAGGGVGTPGSGGGGGGGGGGRQNSGQDDVGGAGGGGGGGGFGGNGGIGGGGGGGSFGVFLFSNGAGGIIVDCRLQAGAGGAGGAGGSGGTGGLGGLGGLGGAAGCGPNPGGNGGVGTAGGSGGAGGSGATGLSINLSDTGGTPVTQNNITSVPGNPPVISVDNHGCTNAEVIFTAPVSGAWNFGAGANPSTANSAGPISVMYNSIGRKTITFGATAFTEFVDIFNNQSVASSITHVNNPAVTGCPDTFSTTLTGTLYEWDFGATSIPATATGTSASASVAFTSTGSHTVVVWVTTACCGRIKDSLTITVNPNSIPVTLSWGPGEDTICAGEPITYTATPAGYLSYTFFVNNTPVQNGPFDQFLVTNLAPGDSVRVIAFDGVCYSNPSATHYPIVYAVPSVILTDDDADDTICSGDLVTFTASPAGYDIYRFSVGGSLQQATSSNVWTSTTLYTNNSVTVVAIQNGCGSPASNAIVWFVKPTPQLTLDPVPPICQGDAVSVHANTSWPNIDYYDFNVNGSSVQNSASDTYTTSTFNNGDSVWVSGGLDGCFSRLSEPIVITVNPTPTVTLTSDDADNSICQGVSVTFTAAPAGYDNYEFFDGITSVQSGASNIYTTNTLVNGNSITVIATNLGCSSAPSTAIVTAVQPAPIVAAGADDNACIDAASITLTGFSPAGGTWTGTGITNPSGTFDPTTAGAGNYSLVYTYTDIATGCSGYDSLVFTVNALPVLTMPTSVDICVGQSTQLGVTVTGGSTYSWSPITDLDNANIQNPVASPAITTPYTVTVTDVNNCSNTGTTTVNVNPNPVADFTVNDVCVGVANVFANNSTPVNGNTYSWNFGDGNSSTLDNPTYTYSSAGSFTAQLIAQLGNCFDTVTNVAVVHPGAVADFTADPLVSYTEDNLPIRFFDQSLNTDSWNWDFGDQTFSTSQSPAHSYLQPGVYTITLIADNQFGCSDTLTRQNYVTIYEQPKIFIPNAFSPNGDGNNDLMQVYSSGTKYIDFMIFNRWGEKVFQTNNLNEGWDGVYKGEPAYQGVYVYTLEVAFDDNTVRDMKGSVTLIR